MVGEKKLSKWCCFKVSPSQNINYELQKKNTIMSKFSKTADWRLNDLVRRFNKYSTNDKMSLDQYRRMMGVLGSTHMTKRMFFAMDKDKDNFIDLEEYLTYNDIILNGTVKEK